MGCDIHGHIEYRYSSGKRQWFNFAAVDINRDYVLFGYMAGVRKKDVEPVVPLRGFPEDASLWVLSEWHEWDGDGHHPGWLTYDELYKAHSHVVSYRNEGEFTMVAVLAAMHSLQCSGMETRLTFWFDN